MLTERYRMIHSVGKRTCKTVRDYLKIASTSPPHGRKPIFSL